MKQNLPKLEIGARPGLRSDVSPKALSRWSSDVRAMAADGPTIDILEPIGADFFGDGVTAKSIARQLRAIGENPVTVNINSPGGDVFEGIAIYNIMRAHDAQVTVNVLGVAASAASIIAMAGNTVNIGKAAFFMIHNAWVVAMGDAPTLREAADWIEPFDEAMAAVYAARTGLDQQALQQMMADETWLSGQQSVDNGFADGFLAADQIETAAADDAAHALRAERAFDIVASRAGATRRQAREILNGIKGIMPGADPADMPGAVGTEPDVFAGILDQIKSIGA